VEEQRGGSTPEHHRSVALPIGVVGEGSRGKEEERASWLHPARRGPKRRRERVD